MALSPFSTGGFEIWGLHIPEQVLDAKHIHYLSLIAKSPIPDINGLWREMDRAWDELGLINDRPMSEQRIGDYYSHPVWLLNGIFTHVDPISQSHRQAIAQMVMKLGARKIADFGGGLGELGLAINKQKPEVFVHIIEPFCSSVGQWRFTGNNAVSIRPALEEIYDCIIAQDVLEHVEDPIGLVSSLLKSLKPEGHAIFANCFHPVIKCHLPATFHLRHTFPWVVQPLGLCYLGRIPGAQHAQVFRFNPAHKQTESALSRERISQFIGPMLNAMWSVALQLYRHTNQWSGRAS